MAHIEHEHEHPHDHGHDPTDHVHTHDHDHDHDHGAHAHDHGHDVHAHVHGHDVHAHDHGHDVHAHVHPHPDTHDADHGHDHHHHHDGDDYYHDHHGDDLTPADIAALTEVVWKLENVELTTVGVDIGSSTSHLMFARVHLQRIADGLSSRFVVVGRDVLWRSPILLTPYRPDTTIDAERLGAFIAEAYNAAGLKPADVDSGAVILTGEALKRTNARAIADLFAAESGKFVCASAGHHLEALMAAHGSGAVGLSRKEHRTLLNVDIGGGTSKFALVRDGEVLHTAAVAVGGRLAVRGVDGDLARIEGPALQAAAAAGIMLGLGQRLDAEDERALVGTWADVIVSVIQEATGTAPSPQPSPPARGRGGMVGVASEPLLPSVASRLLQELLLTDPLPREETVDAITFSGGVAEYIYGREGADYRDFGPALAGEVRAALADGRIPVPALDPGQGIRATVIGASQFTVQVSGNTIFVSDERLLPLHNLPVLYPRLDLSGDVVIERVVADIKGAFSRFDLVEGEDPVALAFRWQGDPFHVRLRGLADGIQRALPGSIERELPLVLLFDGDVGKTLGAMLKHDLGLANPVLSVDGMQLKEFDFVDVGELIQPTNVVPVVIKSLLFAGVEPRSS